MEKEYTKYVSKFQESFLGMVDRFVAAIVAAFIRKKIDYVIIGSIASARYNYFRATEDVDFLILRKDKTEAREIVRQIQKKFEDEEYGSSMNVDIMYSGDISGDGVQGKGSKGLPFKDPKEISNEIHKINYLTLEALIEYKLSSGTYGKGRGMDITDVIRLIHYNKLKKSFGNNFREDLKATYIEVWALAYDISDNIERI